MFSCDFERDLCGFSNIYALPLQFQRTHAYSLVHDYAPERDHTLNIQSGSFLYINTLGTSPDSYGVLRSTRYLGTSNCKVRFYYYINSATNAGQLTVMTRTESVGYTTPLWSTSKVLGERWERQEVALPTGQLSEVLFEVKSLDGGGGFIALDDISFSSECNSSNGYLPYGTSTPTAKPNTPPTCTYQCQDGTCVGKEKVGKGDLFGERETERTQMTLNLALQFRSGL